MNLDENMLYKRILMRLRQETPASTPSGPVTWASVTNKPTTFPATWSDVSGKPTYAPVATSGAYSDLSGRPALFSGAYGDLTGLPSLFPGTWTALSGKPMLFSGAYADLTGLPTLFPGTWTALTGKPTLFSGAYADLTGKPVLFDGAWPSLTSKPTTLAGFGITDAVTGAALTSALGNYTTTAALTALLAAKADVSSVKRIDTYTGTTDANGLLTITYASAFPALPSIQPEPPTAANQVWVKVASTTTGCSLRLVQRASATVVGIEVLLAATTNVAGASARVVVVAA